MKLRLFLGLSLIALTRFASAQTFSGTGGSIITLSDTSRFNINVSGLSPASVDYTFGLESVTININHSRARDIDCFLAAPDGTLIMLTTDNGGTSGSNFTNTIFRNDAATSITSGSAPFTGTYRPEGTLYNVNNGQNGNGTWQLRVIDDSNNGITGSLINWSINFGGNPARPFLFSGSNLPIVVINTNGQSIPDDPKIICDMGIVNNGIGQRNHLNDPFNEYNGKIAIEIRGSSSQSFPKKSYGFETRMPNGVTDTNVALLGMPSEHDWILSANYTDKSFCRNVLLYQLSTEMGHYAARTRYVDVVLNGEYIGIYVLMESIKRDGDRVDIDRLHPWENTAPDITGGYILKVDKTTGSGGEGWTSPYPPINHSNGQTTYLQYDYPDPDSISLQQKAYIQAYVDSFEDALSSSTFMDPINGYQKYIGNGSWIDYFFCNELSKNVDGYRISSYLYKDKNKTLKAGPVWDYDIAWGNANYCGGDDTTGWAYLFSCTGDGYQVPFWWQRLLQDTNYTNQLKCRWQDYRQNVLSQQHIFAIIDSITTLINESKDWNFTVWPILGQYVWPNPSPYPTTYAGEVQNLKNWVTRRLSWLDSNLPGRCNCTVQVVQHNVSCTNACDGYALGNGTSPYAKTYSWDNGLTQDTIFNLCPGDYTVTMEDAIGCSRTTTVTITEPAPLSVGISTANSNCSGAGCNGTATASPSAGTAPYSYAWSNGQTSATATGLCAGTYTVTVTDANGCTKTTSATIINPVAPTVSLASSSMVSCAGGSNGSATISVTGGNAPYGYAWTPNVSTTASASNLAAGTYTVRVTDANNCEAYVSIDITEPSALQTTVSSSDVRCAGSATGQASVQVNGGAGGFSFAWSPGGAINDTLYNASAGSYTVTITDANGCTRSATTIVGSPSPIGLSFNATPASCNGGSDGQIILTASGGTGTLHYSWAGSTDTGFVRQSLAAGVYACTITDDNGCTQTGSVQVTEPAKITLSTASTPSDCQNNNGSAQVSASGGTGSYSYSWFPSGGNAASASGLASGDYIITVTDANGCVMADTVTVGSTGGLQLTLASASMVKCFGGSDGSASVNATSGTPPYQYAWSPGGGTTNTLNGLSAGNYSVQVTDVSGCTVTLPVSITQPDVLQAATSTTAVSCFGASTGAATVTVTGGTLPYTYLWNPGNATTTVISNRPAGNYTVTITDANACTTTSAASILQPPVINLNMQSTPVSCNATNGTATVIPSGGSGAFTFSWFPSNDTTATADSLAPGTYVVVVTDGNGCTRSGNVTVNALPVPHVQVDSSRSVTCNGDTNGAVFCSVSGGAAPFNYQWTGTAGTGSSLTNIGAGIYQLLVIDANGCRDSVLAQVQEPSPLAILLTTENVLCAGAASGRIFAEVGGGVPPYSYNWTPGGQVNDTAVGLTGGTYQVFVTDSNGCTTQGSAAITEPAAIQATVTGVDALCATNCDGHGEVTIAGGVEPYFVTWCNGDTTRQVNNLCGGDCQVLITDGNGCGISQTISLQQPDTLQLTVAHTNPSCQGCADGTASVDVSGGLPPYAYDWSPVTGTADSISALVAGWYVVCVTDSGGCSRCDSVEVLDGPVGLEEVAFQSGLYVYPNPFSDATTFLFSLAVTQDVRLEIFDMTGQLVSVVARDRLAAGVHRFRWESPQLAPGLYQFRFLNGQRSQAGTLVIQR